MTGRVAGSMHVRGPMPELHPVISEKEIQCGVDDLARRISSDYRGRNLVLVGVLNGAFMFLADLSRRISIPHKIDFVRVKSYGDATESSGNIEISKDIELDITGCDVLLVEDIVDTGLSISFLKDLLALRGPSSVRVCAAVDKEERRKTPVEVDYRCFRVNRGFLVGYGLDMAEQYRSLPAIYEIKL